MYQSFRRFCERLLRLPPDMEPPPGDEASTQLFLAAPNFYRYLVFLWAVRTVLTFAIVAFTFGMPTVGGAIALGTHNQRWGWLLLLIPAVALSVVAVDAVFRLAVVRLDFDKRWYVVTDRSLRIREGVLTVREMTVTFANIQNIAISQGPLQRLLRIADVRVETAGGGGGGRKAGEQAQTENLHTAFFRGIDNADEVRSVIQQRLRLVRGAGLGDQDELPAMTLAESSPAYLQALRQVLAEAQLLRTTVESRD